MSQIISQNLTLPANVTAGGTVQPADVSTLYTAMNSFSIPDAIASLIQSVYSTGSAITITGPSTSTANSASDISIALAASKVLINIGTFDWATTGVSFALAFRKNGTEFGRTPTISTSTAGNGMFFMVVAPHDATYTVPAFGIVTGGTTSTGNFKIVTSTVALANAAWTSIGIQTLGTTSTAHVVTIGSQRVWRET